MPPLAIGSRFFYKFSIRKRRFDALVVQLKAE